MGGFVREMKILVGVLAAGVSLFAEKEFGLRRDRALEKGVVRIQVARWLYPGSGARRSAISFSSADAAESLQRALFAARGRGEYGNPERMRIRAAGSGRCKLFSGRTFVPEGGRKKSEQPGSSSSVAKNYR